MQPNSLWNYVASGASAIVVSSLFNGLEVVRTRQVRRAARSRVTTAPMHTDVHIALSLAVVAVRAWLRRPPGSHPTACTEPPKPLGTADQ